MKALAAQTMVDLVIQEHGDIEKIMDFAQENGVDIDKSYQSGEQFTGGSENEVTRFFDSKGIKVVNGEPDASKYPGKAYGTDYSQDYS